MSPNVAIIFLALLIGVIIGYGIGVHNTSKKIGGMLSQISEQILKVTKEEEKRRRERINDFNKMLDDVLTESLKKKKENEQDDEIHAADR